MRGPFQTRVDLNSVAEVYQDFLGACATATIKGLLSLTLAPKQEVAPKQEAPTKQEVAPFIAVVENMQANRQN